MSDTAVAVTNVTPTAAGELGLDEYNALLRELHDAVFVPSLSGLDGITVEYDDGENALKGRLTSEALRSLEEFARCANRESGASHPNDRDRWLAFILAAHRSRATLSADLLARWLREACDFPFDVAQRLAEEYEHARDLLKRYDQAAA